MAEGFWNREAATGWGIDCPPISQSRLVHASDVDNFILIVLYDNKMDLFVYKVAVWQVK